MCRKPIDLFSLAVVVGFVLASVAAAADPTLVGWWQFEEASGTLYDQSDNHNDGIAYNGVLYQQSGFEGYALRFDGRDDYVTVGATGRPTDTFSFGAWLKTSARHEVDAESTYGTAGTSRQKYAFEPADGGEADGGAGLSVGTNGISVYEHGSNYMPATAVYSSDIGIDWNHVMVVYQDKQPTIYLNGQAVRTGITSPRARVLAPIQLGGMAYGYFRGLMDEVRIYNRALSAAEVKELAARLKAHSPDPPDGATYWISWFFSWKPGDTAKYHDIYVGTNPTPGPAEYKDRVPLKWPRWAEIGGWIADQTYYWRIDEVEADGTTIHTGYVWSFKAAPDIHITITDPNLVGWWKLDEADGTTVLDWSGQANHGTLVGDPQRVVGYAGGALELDGTNWVDFGNPPDFWITDALTITCWVDPAGLSGDQGFVAQDGGYVLKTSGDHLRFTTPGVMGHDGYNTILQTGTWQHVAATFEVGRPGGLVFYLNGDETDRLDASALEEGTGPVRIGTNQWSETYTGLIDEVRVYNTVLTQAEIKEAMRGDPLLAWNPNPADGSTPAPDIEHTTSLSWSPGDKASKHDVYFGTDDDAVEDADTTTTGIYRGRQYANTYTPPEGVELAQSYYWRIDEYNKDATISQGRVWSFTVADYLLVDDYEAYDDYCNRIFYTWGDGWGHNGAVECRVPAYGGNGTGSTVGYLAEPYAEQTITHDGSFQSMPMEYLNDGSTGKALYSETERTFDPPQDWTRHDVKALTLWFRGSPGNVAERLYVALEDSTGQAKAVPHPNPNAVQLDSWQEWPIDLADFASVDITRVKKTYIGVGDRDAPKLGGGGMLYIDDIRLYMSRCMPNLVKPAGDFNSNCVVDLADIEILAGEWLQSGAGLTADLDTDEDVDLADFAEIADGWLEQLLWPQP